MKVILAVLVLAAFAPAQTIYWANPGDDTIPAFSPIASQVDSVIAVALDSVGVRSDTMTVADKLYPGTVSALNPVSRMGWRLKLRLRSSASPDTARRMFRLVWRDLDGARIITNVWMTAEGDSVLSTTSFCKLDTVIVYGRESTDSFGIIATPMRPARTVSATTVRQYPLVAVTQEVMLPRTRARCLVVGEGAVRVVNTVQSGYKLVLDTATGWARGVEAMPDTGWTLGTVLSYCAAGGDAWAGIQLSFAGDSAIATVVPESLIGEPVGTIIEWYGDSTSWPGRYVLCDGTLKYKNAAGDSVVTPDLRGFFVVGASGDSAGLPSSTITGVEHTSGGDVSYTPVGSVGAISATGGVGLGATASPGSSYADQNHTHPAPTFSGTQDSIIPPFRAAWKLIRSRTW